ncbi:hypothetical protein C8R43DRAFT_381893 [Mycena crocata]|nr:hypothetical protein C8R43DRAFT_381893 [Mycena crocata]
MGFRSAPNLLAEIEDSPSRSWSTIPTIQRQSAPIESHLPLQENIFDGSSCKSHERNNLSPTTSRVSQPFLDEQRGSTLDTPIFGPREEGLFRNEMPYDMVSPLSQLASGWRESPRHSPNSLVFNQHGGPSRQDSASRRSKSPATESPSEWSLRRVPPSRPMDRPVSPELYHDNPVDGTYYIIPGGMDVVFQAEDGREITRVGDFSGRRRRISPIIIQDQYGHELYR